jgi:DNA-binding NarL/FixJ family response regulator
MAVRCLIVDDNPGFLQTARRVLQDGGITVVGTAATAAEAVAKAAEAAPDVVIVDVILGAESGFSVARELAALRGARSLRIIMISTHPGDDFADLISASPAIAFLPKWELSAAAVRKLVSQAAQAAAD